MNNIQSIEIATFSYLSLISILYWFNIPSFVDIFYYPTALIGLSYSIYDIHLKYRNLHIVKYKIRSYELIIHHLVTCYLILNSIREKKYLYKVLLIELSSLFLFLNKLYKKKILNFLFLITWIGTRFIYFPFVILDIYHNDDSTYFDIFPFMILNLFNFKWTIESLIRKKDELYYTKCYSSIVIFSIPLFISKYLNFKSEYIFWFSFYTSTIYGLNKVLFI